MDLDFTVLIACYHGDKIDRFNDAIDSIIKNTLKPKEIILVQDGPVNKEMSLYIERLASDGVVTLIKIDNNQGLTNALNLGLKSVTTKYVLRVDSDDINSETRFFEQMHELSLGYDVVGSAINEYDDNNNFLSKKIMPQSHEEIARYLKHRNPINHMTVGFDVSKVRMVGGYPSLSLREDYGLWIKLISSNCNFKNSSESWVSVIRNEEMYKRRGGVKHIISELKLQRLLVKNKVNNIFESLLIGIVRISLICLPAFLMKTFYEKYLRDNG